MNKTTKIDLLNIFIMLTSMVLALYIPFRLFLISYAILGPLHYLTEINWLDKKDYFVSNRASFLKITLFIVFAIGMLNVVYYYHNEFSWLNDIYNSSGYEFVSALDAHLIFGIFISSIFMILSGNWTVALSVGFLGSIIGFMISDFSSYNMIFGLFLPSIIHVFLFTGLFMLYGALKSNSTIGVISFFILLLIGAIPFFLYDPGLFQYDEVVISTFTGSNFEPLNFYIANWFEDFNEGHPFVLTGELGVRVQTFIAYAYIYHYLNWFTKTTVIKWHLVDRKSLVVIIGLWLVSVYLFYLDYKMGMVALLVLSYLHVILEFPLNIISVKGILSSLFKRNIR